MPLSQLLITLDSFQSLPLAGATLLRRARTRAESDAGGSGLGGVCRPREARGPPSSRPLPAGGVLPERNLSPLAGGDCQV